MQPSTTTIEDDTPTKRIENVRSPVLTALARIDRHLELAIERLLVDADPDSIIAAVSDLAAARGIVRTVTR